jgi:hypothetical protein
VASRPVRKKNQFILDLVVLAVCLILFGIAMTITALYFIWLYHRTF